MNPKPELETQAGNGEGPSVEPPMFYPPRFWRDETSGVLAPAIHRYLVGRTKPEDIPVLRAYCRQWIDSPAWDMNPNHDDESRAELAGLRKRAAAITTIRHIDAWIAFAVDFGVDPL